MLTIIISLASIVIGVVVKILVNILVPSAERNCSMKEKLFRISVGSLGIIVSAIAKVVLLLVIG